jgi:hypothetical protein
MKQCKWTPALLVAMASLLSGCRIIAAGVVTVAAVVGLAGYVVYKTGDAAVTGVGKAARATGDAVSSGSKSMATVIYADGEFKTEYPSDLRTVWIASGLAFRKAKFSDIQGTFDALSGGLTARTLDNVEITLKLKSLGAQATEAGIRVGVKGDMKTSEIIHDLILRELPAPVAPQPAPKQEVKP